MGNMKNTKVIHKIFFVVVILILLLTKTPNKATANENTTFNVNVQEFLSVTIATPSEWASGDIDTFLRNKVSLNITSNNSGGFTASMTTKTPETSLINTSKSTVNLPRLASNTSRNSFPANYWGYSLNDTESGSGTSTYSAVASSTETPITILSSNSATGSKNFYFGAKADSTKASGTYVGTVVISVVSGVVDTNTNPANPVNPANPTNDQTPTYDASKGSTAYTYHRNNNPSSGMSSTTTEISSGDNRNSYQGYTPPQGVTYSTTSKLSTGATIATGLGIVASIAATSGFFFLAAARREGEDDDEEEDGQQSF